MGQIHLAEKPALLFALDSFLTGRKEGRVKRPEGERDKKRVGRADGTRTSRVMTEQELVIGTGQELKCFICSHHY